MAKKNQNENITPKNPIIVQSMDDVMHSSMMPYAEHVILERALPRVEDGFWFNFGDALARDGHESDAPYAMMVGYRYCNAARQQKTKQLWKRLISDPGTSPEVPSRCR